jgi:hypothetical protein
MLVACVDSAQVIEAGYASCTGLSIFLADACRSVCCCAAWVDAANIMDPEGMYAHLTWAQQSAHS